MVHMKNVLGKTVCIIPASSKGKPVGLLLLKDLGALGG